MTNIRPTWVAVAYAAADLASAETLWLSEAITAVTAPITISAARAAGECSISGAARSSRYTPACTERLP